MSQRPRVFLRHCPSYDVEKVRSVVGEALEALRLTPRGRVLVKPNVVASGTMFQHAHTRPEVVEGVVLALRDKAEGLSDLVVGERCGITMPTRYAFEGAGFNPMLERLKVRRSFFEEEQQVEIPLTHPGRLRDSIFVPRPVAEADFFVNVPKFKSHPWTTVTFSMKNYIGIQDDRHRLIDHDHRLDEKVADLQHVLQPRLVVVDAVVAGEQRMLTPIPRPLELLVLGDNQPAVDAVCCAIIGVDPHSVAHIRLAHERGFGPIDLDQIELGGDVTLEEAQGRAKGFKVGLVRVEKYFEGTHLVAYAGPPPEGERTDYCWGGCPGAIEEAVEILRLFDQQFDQKLEKGPRVHVVFGAYEGPIDVKEGERVVFVGDCARWEGRLRDEPVQVDSVYQPRETKDPHHPHHEDLYAKMVALGARLAKARGQSHLRLTGCPVSVAEQVLALVALTGAKNPYFDRGEIVSFNKAYLAWKAAVARHRLTGRAYQVAGPAHRGDAAVGPLTPEKPG